MLDASITAVEVLQYPPAAEGRTAINIFARKAGCENSLKNTRPLFLSLIGRHSLTKSSSLVVFFSVPLGTYHRFRTTVHHPVTSHIVAISFHDEDLLFRTRFRPRGQLIQRR